MRVAIDTGPLTSEHAVRGIGVHTRQLVEELKKLENGGFKIDAFDFSVNSKQLTANSYDIVYYPFFHPFFLTLPFSKPAKKVVVTIHDLIPLIYPKHYPPGFKGNIRFMVQRYLLKNVDAILTISETSKKDICRFLGVHPDKVHVTYLAPKRIFRKVSNTSILYSIEVKYGLPKKFVLYVGDINYNKNIPGLIKACKLADIPLVICGKQALDIEEGAYDMRNVTGPRDWMRYLFGLPHPELAHYKDLVNELKRSKKIIRLGFVPDEDLVALYNLASVYVQPSFYEGFGLPILEAMASGCPVVSSKTQALVEIGEGAALFADPNDSKDMAEKINTVISDVKLKEKLITTGHQKVRQFSWEKVAKETLAVYRSILKNENS